MHYQSVAKNKYMKEKRIFLLSRWNHLCFLVKRILNEGIGWTLYIMMNVEGVYTHSPAYVFGKQADMSAGLTPAEAL